MFFFIKQTKLDKISAVEQPDTLGEFLKDRFSERGKQAEFCRKTGLESGSVTKWKNGSPPDFENCLRIADYFDKTPLEIFTMAGKPEFASLYKRFFPEYRREELTETDLYKNQRHAKFHTRLQEYLAYGIERLGESFEERWMDFELALQGLVRQMNYIDHRDEDLIELYADPENAGELLSVFRELERRNLINHPRVQESTEIHRRSLMDRGS